MIAAMKHVVAHVSGHAGWATVRPPLTTLSQADGERLWGQLSAIGFDMPAYPRH